MASISSGLQQTQTQRLALSLSQRQSVELLQLTGPELQTQIDAALAANPLLESVQDGGFERPQVSAPITPEPLACDEPAGVAHDFREPSYLTWAKTSSVDDEEFDPYAKLASHESLVDYLMQEVAGMRLAPQTRALVSWLVGNLDDHGFFTDDLLDCAKCCPIKASTDEWENALEILRRMDPAGIGAKNAIDALVLQLERLDGSISDLAIRLLTQTRELLVKRDFKAIAKILKTDEDSVLKAYALICTLNPHPVAQFADDNESVGIIAEVIISRTASGLKATLNPAVVPYLRFDEETFELLTRAKLSKDQRNDWKRKADDAKMFVRSVEQRFATIVAVAQTIVDLQPEFFSLGNVGLKPMVLKDVAGRLGMAESTVSRATAGKYMQTPLGTFEFKSFFSSSVAGTDGQNISSTAVRRRIAEIVAAENPAKPLSDNAIAEILAKEGIELARRTVTKYRELEHIAPKALRKILL